MTENTITLTMEDKTAKVLVDTIRASVNGDGKYLAYATAHKVTRENVADHARALAVLAYPNDKPVQKADGVRTRFGNAVQKAGAGLRSVLDKADPTATDWMKLVRQAVDNAAEKGGFTAERILSEVREVLRGEADKAA